MANVQTSGETHIHILFENGKSGDAPESTPAAPKQEGEPSKSNPLKSKSDGTNAQIALNIGMSLGKQAMNTAVSNIGLATGNYYMQSQVQNGIRTVSSMIGLGTAVASGNIPALIMQIGGMAISAVSQTYQDYKQRQIENYAAAQNARRAGFTEDRR